MIDIQKTPFQKLCQDLSTMLSDANAILQQAASYGRLRLVKRLLQQHPHADILKATNAAAANARWKTLAYLWRRYLSHGLNLEMAINWCLQSEAWRLLSYVIRYHNTQIPNLDMIATTLGIDVQRADIDLPLEITAATGDVAMTHWHLVHGIQKYSAILSAFDTAIQHLQLEVVKVLRANLNTIPNEVLVTAAKHGADKIVYYLLCQNCCWEWADYAAFRIAAESGHLAVVKIFLECAKAYEHADLLVRNKLIIDVTGCEPELLTQKIQKFQLAWQAAYHLALVGNHKDVLEVLEKGNISN